MLLNPDTNRILSPAARKAVRKASAKHRGGVKQDWREWVTLDLAMSQGTQEQVLAWSSFEFFRQAIAGHKTYDHMRVWLDAFFTQTD